jgi:hypothetical protein
VRFWAYLLFAIQRSDNVAILGGLLITHLPNSIRLMHIAVRASTVLSSHMGTVLRASMFMISE